MCGIFICIGLHEDSRDLPGKIGRFVEAAIMGEHGNEFFLLFFSLVNVYSNEETWYREYMV